MIYNKRVHIDMYVDVKGTEKEIFEEVNDIINRTITEFSYVDVLLEASSWRNMYTDDESTCRHVCIRAYAHSDSQRYTLPVSDNSDSPQGRVPTRVQVTR